MADTDRVTFTKASADRIADAVRTVERGNRDQSALSLGSVTEPGTPVVLRFGTFSGSWTKGTDKVVTFASGSTVLASNGLANISVSSCGSKNCWVVRDGAAWRMLTAEIG